MKFEKPEVEVKKFSTVDVLTTSGVSREGAVMEGECRGTAWDNTLEEDCI